MKNGEKMTQWKQWAACITVSMAMASTGTFIGWATTILPRLMDDDSPMPITSDQSSWLFSMPSIGALIGCIVGVVCCDNFGRKKTLILTGLTYIVGWVITLLATGVNELYVARVILGVGGGASLTVCPLYISEIANVNIRGAMGTIAQLNVITGMALPCIIGPFISTKELTIILLLLPVLVLVCFVWFPESPCYLASKGGHEKAAKSLAFFRGIANIKRAREDLEIVVREINQNMERSTWREKLLEMLMPNNRRSMVVVIFMIFAQTFSGGIVVQSYMNVLFRKVNIGMDPDFATSMVFVASIVTCGAGSVLIERIGRRPLLMVSSLGMAGATAVLGTYILLIDNGVVLQFLNWLPFVLTVLTLMFYMFGLSIIPMVLIGEIFPTNVKGIASAAVMLAAFLFMFIVTKLYQDVGDALGDYVNYYCYSVTCLMSFFFVLVVVPETRNRTVREIQEELADNRRMCCGRGKFDLQ